MSIPPYTKGRIYNYLHENKIRRFRKISFFVCFPASFSFPFRLLFGSERIFLSCLVPKNKLGKGERPIYIYIHGISSPVLAYFPFFMAVFNSKEKIFIYSSFPINYKFFCVCPIWQIRRSRFSFSFPPGIPWPEGVIGGRGL